MEGVDKPRLLSYIVSTAGVMTGVGVLLVWGNGLPSQVPLWYSRPWGEEQLAEAGWLWIIPGITAVIGFAGGWLERRIKDKVLAIMVLGSVTATQVILTVGLLRIIYLIS
ncbi:hypothetical protein A3D85_02290 [Candidatus Amesbacteria bacterium RIFCSPHIGHO2_02_FULL_47_9]|nr:MAG: hypothetical protein A3D85_02290 [Candidatus Amesbacteria bacterium RIFCSPHIGHO2_02_FULL_47_9]